MKYDFKGAEELVWAIVTAAGIAAVQLLNTTDPAKLDDPLFWKITLGGAIIRAAFGAVISWAKNHQAASPLTDEQIRAIVAEELAKTQPASRLVTP